jgi:uncharacterized protein YjbJ (UPF0337 family)
MKSDGTLMGTSRSATRKICGVPRLPLEEDGMDWDRIAGNWKQFGGKIKEKWGQLTDDDVTAINGRRDQLEGKLQERYGWAKDQVRRDVDDWLDAM